MVFTTGQPRMDTDEHESEETGKVIGETVIGGSVKNEGVVDRQDVTKGKRRGGKATKKA